MTWKSAERGAIKLVVTLLKKIYFYELVKIIARNKCFSGYKLFTITVRFHLMTGMQRK